MKKNRDITGGELKRALDLTDVSEKTVRRRLTESGEFKSYWKVKKPFISEKNRKIRVKWCEDRIDWPVSRWRKLMYTDESPYLVRYGCRIRVWRTKNERYKPLATKATVKHDKKINVWGSFAAHGVGDIYRVPGMLLYMMLLYETLLIVR